jgi:tRNA threonylcarbamoyladenosine biosynthesis protein TsaB
MRALAIDTSTPRGGVLLSSDGTVVVYLQNDDPKLHAERLMPLIERAFAEAGWSASQLDLVGCGIGPGSFTGVRIGLATAKGIALALERPIVGVSSLLAMSSAAECRDDELILSLLDARKGEVFWAIYDRAGALLAGPGHAPNDAVGRLGGALAERPRVVVGEIAAQVALDLPGVRLFRSEQSDLPHAYQVARVALARLARGEADDVHGLEPVYVRPPDITMPAAATNPERLR